jgi:hypothetical protein
VSLHIAMGRSWLGHRVRQGSVLYIAAEGGLGITERLQAFCLNHSLTDSPPFHLIPVGIDLCHAGADLREIIREAGLIGNATLIVIDTLSRALSGGNENSSDDMGAFIKNCDLIREQTGAHVLIIHHAGKDAVKGARGHSSLRAAVDTEIEVVKDESGIITAEVKKQRDGKTGDRFGFTLKPVHLGNDDEGDSISSGVLVPTDAPEKKKKPKLSSAQSRAMDIFHNLAVAKGERGTPKPDMPIVTFVRVSDFRTALRDGNISSATEPDSINKAIKRAIDSLNDKGITATWKDMIWATGQNGQ